MLFRYYPANKSNLYYGIFNLAFGSTFLGLATQMVSTEPDTVQTFVKIGNVLRNIYGPALIAMLYTIFYKRIPKFYWIFFSLFATSLVLGIMGIYNNWFNGLTMLTLVVESFRMVVVSIIKKRDGAWIIGTGIISTVVFFIFAIIISAGGITMTIQANAWVGAVFGFTVILATLSIPLSMTVYLARDFARVNKSLQKKLIEVEDLSAKSIEQEKEKQAILANQNEVLEHQVKERTAEIVEQKKVIEEKNKDITDSISYAKRLQLAILPAESEIKKYLPDSFLFYKPKDIVAGDFYWMHVDDNYVFIAAADCTGHGVPGAMVSVVCSNALNRAVNEFNLTDTGKILDKTRELVIETFEKSDSEVKDSMDISLLRIERNKTGNEIKVQWSGANNSLFYVPNNPAPFSLGEGRGPAYRTGRDEAQIIEVKADKQPIGKYGEANPFTAHELTFNGTVSFYLYSDGYADQFSANNKKLLKKKFKEQLIYAQQQSMQEQGAFIEKCHTDWKGSMEQTDDVLVIGLKITQ